MGVESITEDTQGVGPWRGHLLLFKVCTGAQDLGVQVVHRRLDLGARGRRHPVQVPLVHLQPGPAHSLPATCTPLITGGRLHQGGAALRAAQLAHTKRSQMQLLKGEMSHCLCLSMTP